MLFHIRSPAGDISYNNIILLPCARTIITNLSIINTVCGFDPNVFELFKTHLQSKT